MSLGEKISKGKRKGEKFKSTKRSEGEKEKMGSKVIK
jgi:hypothetical protein